MRARSGSAIKNVYTRQIIVRKAEPDFLTKVVICCNHDILIITGHVGIIGHVHREVKKFCS